MAANLTVLYKTYLFPFFQDADVKGPKLKQVYDEHVTNFTSRHRTAYQQHPPDTDYKTLMVEICNGVESSSIEKSNAAL